MASAVHNSSFGRDLITVEGLPELLRKFDNLDKKMRRKIGRKAVSLAATPIQQAARALIPVGLGLDPRGAPRMHLRATMGKKTVSFQAGAINVALVGSRSSSAPHGHLVHAGTGEFVTGAQPAGSNKPRKGNRNYMVPAGKVLRIPIRPLMVRPKAPRMGKAVQPTGFIYIRGPYLIRNRGTRATPFLERGMAAARNQSLEILTRVLRQEIDGDGAAD